MDACLVHDYPVTQFVLGEHAMRVAFRREGSLARLIVRGREQATDRVFAKDLHDYAHTRFSWKELRPQYVGMLRKCRVVSNN